MSSNALDTSHDGDRLAKWTPVAWAAALKAIPGLRLQLMSRGSSDSVKTSIGHIANTPKTFDALSQRINMGGEYDKSNIIAQRVTELLKAYFQVVRIVSKGLLSQTYLQRRHLWASALDILRRKKEWQVTHIPPVEIELVLASFANARRAYLESTPTVRKPTKLPRFAALLDLLDEWNDRHRFDVPTRPTGPVSVKVPTRSTHKSASPRKLSPMTNQKTSEPSGGRSAMPDKNADVESRTRLAINPAPHDNTDAASTSSPVVIDVFSPPPPAAPVPRPQPTAREEFLMKELDDQIMDRVRHDTCVLAYINTLRRQLKLRA